MGSCVCPCLRIPVSAVACVCLGIEKPEDSLGCHPQELSSSFEAGSLTGLELSNQGKLAGQKTQKLSCPHFPSAVTISSCQHVQDVLTQAIGAALGSSWLESKHFTH